MTYSQLFLNSKGKIPSRKSLFSHGFRIATQFRMPGASSASSTYVQYAASPPPCRLYIILDLEMVLLSCACQDFFCKEVHCSTLLVWRLDKLWTKRQL